MRGAVPSSSRARTSRPLVALLKWLTTCRRPSTSCSTRTVATRRARSGVGRQNAAYVDERRSTSRPPPSALAHHRVEVRAPVRGDPAEPGQGDVTGEPVGGDRVTGAHQPEHRRGHRQPPRRPAACGAVQRGEVESLVEHAGVDPVRPRRPGRVQALRCARSSAACPTPSPSTRSASGCSALVRTSASSTCRRASVSAGSDSRSRSSRAAAPRRRLALGGRQQDQHRASLGRGHAMRGRPASVAGMTQHGIRADGGASAAGARQRRRRPAQGDRGDPGGAEGQRGVPGGRRAGGRRGGRARRACRTWT